MTFDELKIFSYNVRGLGEKRKRLSIFRFLKANYKGIIFLQETHSTRNIENLWKGEWGGKIYFGHGTSKSNGVAILFPRQICHNVHEEIKGADGRILTLKVEINGEIYIFANHYSPTKDKTVDQVSHFEELRDIMEAYNAHKLIIGGDFNVCLNPLLDKSGGKAEKQSESALKLIEYCDVFGLTDIWRVRNPESLRFTRRQNTRSGIVHSRLDFFLVSEELQFNIRDTEIKPSICSDHSIVEISMYYKSPGERNNKGFFKFNTSLLQDKTYVEKVKTCITNIVEINRDIENKNILWDTVKCSIRGMTIGYSSAKVKERRQHENEIMERLGVLEPLLTTNEADTIQEYETLKHDYEDIQKIKAQGLMVRSRAQDIEYGERNTKYFLNLEKRNQNIKNITCIINDAGNLLTEPTQILQEEVNFYSKLYSDPSEIEGTSSDIDDISQLSENFFLNNDIPQLANNQQLLCDKEIDIEECGVALYKLKNNKTPGSDGLPAEFYKFFWTDIKTLLYESYRYSLVNGTLSIDQRRGILSIIPKKGKDLRFLKNWRPLSLLNTDYKILTKVLANRLQLVIDDIVSKDQNGYIKGRFIGDNIRTIADVIDYANLYKQSGIIALLDFEKAFDTVNWTFLEMTLEKFGFGDVFRRWIIIFYTDISSCCVNNGKITPFFKISRGIRQGCPISALLFILVVEVLAEKIREDKSIPGIHVDDTEIKITQLADDTTLFLHDLDALEVALELLDKFRVCSGLKLNITKTEIFYLGNTNHRPNKLGLKEVDTTFQALGIYFCSNTNEMITRNFEDRFTKFKNTLNIWSQRDLSLKGKVTIIKSLALPQLIYVSNVLPVPEDTIDKVEREMQRFLWNHKPSKIKLITVISDTSQGGIKMPHFTTIIKSQKIMWIKRLLDDKKSKWKAVGWKLLGIPEHILLAKYSTKFLNEDIPPFYKQVLTFWYELLTVAPEPNIVHEEELWNNSLITIGGKPVNNNQWQVQGITRIKDLYNTNGGRMTKEQLSVKYNVSVDTLFYNGLINAIPIQWREIMTKYNEEDRLTEKANDDIYIQNKYVKISSLNNRMLYWHLLNRITKPPTVLSKWMDEYPFLNDQDFGKYFTLPYNITRDTKLQTFQYKILNNIIPCQSMLFRWGLAENNLCANCNTYDGLSHYFYECTEVNDFWKQLIRWIKNHMGVQIPLAEVDILFGIPFMNDSLLLCVNLLILLGKRYIHQCKNYHKNIFLFEFLPQVKTYLVIEEYTAKINDKNEKFIERYGMLYEML